MAITGRATRAGIVRSGNANNWMSGVDTATEMLSMLGHIGSDIAGIMLAAKRRSDGRKGAVNNAQVVQYLADGGRDIRPTYEDKAEAAATMRTLITAKLLMMTKRGAPPKAWSEARKQEFIAKGRVEANKIAALALRKAGQQMHAKMLERVNNPGNYDAVSERYAQQRQSKYGVPTSAVFRATGQLLSNIADGHLRLIKRKDLLSRISGALQELGDQAADMILH
jgi:hypothetical protein